MFAYKTNSPDYLDYVASVLTREEILADPNLCMLLENEYIKDNMEIAILYNKAKYGDYQDKYDFVEYLMCNGPELDADSILHYRAKCAIDPTMMEIAYSYLNDANKLSDIRTKKYGKKSDDCFSNPCFYLGKFSAVMGSIGDSKATFSPFNTIADLIWSTSHEKQAEATYGKQLRQGIIDQATYDAKIAEAKAKDAEEKAQREGNTGSNAKVMPSGSAIPTGTDAGDKMPPVGMSRPCFVQSIIPAIQKGWNMMIGQVLEGNCEFTSELVNSTNCLTNAKRLGDWMAQPVAEMIDLSSKANVHRHLGDCARLWSQVRRLNLFGKENVYSPVTADQLVGDTYVDGTPMTPIANTYATAKDTSVTLEEIHDSMQETDDTYVDLGLMEEYDYSAPSLFPDDTYESYDSGEEDFEEAVPVSESGIKLY